jgi:hypothetical protein
MYIPYRMNAASTPQSLLKQIAQIQRMEPGKLCVMRQSAEGPYYNLQCRQDGKVVTRYVPRGQVQTAAENTANYARFAQLVEQYARTVAEQSRAEREEGSKKRPATSNPPGPGRRNPKSHGPISSPGPGG